MAFPKTALFSECVVHLDNPLWLVWSTFTLIIVSVNAYVTLTALAS